MGGLDGAGGVDSMAAGGVCGRQEGSYLLMIRRRYLLRRWWVSSWVGFRKITGLSDMD